MGGWDEGVGKSVLRDCWMLLHAHACTPGAKEKHSGRDRGQRIFYFFGSIPAASWATRPHILIRMWKKRGGEEEEKKEREPADTTLSAVSRSLLICRFLVKEATILPTGKKNTKINPNTQQHQKWRRRAKPRLDHCSPRHLRVWQNSHRCHFKKNMKKMKKRWRRGERSCLNNDSEGNEPQPPAFVGDYGRVSPGLVGRRSAVGWRHLMKDKLNFL